MSIQRRFMPLVIKRILDKMPGTIEELAAATGLNSSTVSRYIQHMYPSMCLVCGHKGNNPDHITANPARIYGAGAGVDAVYVHRCESSEYAEKRKEYMAERRKLSRQENEDPDHAKILINLHAKARRNVSKALTKQNTPFGPLFDLQEKNK